MTATDKRLSDLEARVQAIADDLGSWGRRFDKMNTYFESAGVGLRWESGDLVNSPELAHPAPNRNIEDYT